MNPDNVKRFNALYIKGMNSMTVCLENSDKFSNPADTRKFSDEDKSDFIDELDGRRAKIAEAKLKS